MSVFALAGPGVLDIEVTLYDSKAHALDLCYFRVVIGLCSKRHMYTTCSV